MTSADLDSAQPATQSEKSTDVSTLPARRELSAKLQGDARRSAAAERLVRRREGFVDSLRDVQDGAEAEIGWAPRRGGWVMLAVSLAAGFAASVAWSRR